MDRHTFRAVGYPLRLHAGVDALEKLEAEVVRQGAERAFVVTGRTIANRTRIVERIEHNLGKRYAGVFGELDKDSTWPSVERAVHAARAAKADLVVAVGGGSVIVGARVVAILLGESGDPYDLMTQYPSGKPAFSPRLDAPKPPIINVPTTPTSAMNRAGSGLKNDELDHRMEFYDPKTRPVALFWDSEALLTAPAHLIRSTATTTFTGAMRVLGSAMNPLVEGDRRQAFHLLKNGLTRIMSETDNADLRIDLCAAAFLENRAADDDQGRRRDRDPASASAYALATALHVRYDQVWQGEATSAVTPTVIRLTPEDDLNRARRVATALGVWRDGMDPAQASNAAADALDTLYTQIGMPSRVGQLEIPRNELSLVANDTLKNFNANPGDRSEDYAERMLKLLEAAWS